MLLSFEMSLKELIHFIFLTLHSQEQQKKKALMELKLKQNHLKAHSSSGSPKG